MHYFISSALILSVLILYVLVIIPSLLIKGIIARPPPKVKAPIRKNTRNSFLIFAFLSVALFISFMLPCNVIVTQHSICPIMLLLRRLLFYYTLIKLIIHLPCALYFWQFSLDYYLYQPPICAIIRILS